MVHIWHEDSENSATQKFWEFLRDNDVSQTLKGADIRGFSGNENLQSYIEEAYFDINDTYYIFMDYVKDNIWAYNTWCDTRNYIKSEKLNNVIMSRLNCFEFMILEFSYFREWTKPLKGLSKDYLEAEKILSDYVKIIRARKSWRQNEDILKYALKINNITEGSDGWRYNVKKITSEQLSTSILSILTNGGRTKFGVSKTKLGDCWITSCCTNTKSNVTGICALHLLQYSAKIKADKLWKFAANNYIK